MSQASISMDVERVFHMNGGLGKSSYAQNSSLQRKTREMVNDITVNTIADFYLREIPGCLYVAELGCSSGPNALSLVKEIINKIDETCHATSLKEPQVHVFLNDLPGNDFNSIFKGMPGFIRSLSECGRRDGPSSVFVAGVPGSFYGRLFPNNTLHFVHSSYCLHWLSQVPEGLFDENNKAIDKGKIYISGKSPPLVMEAYSEQFQKDFAYFLKSRSSEIVVGGRMVLIMLGRRTNDHSDEGVSFLWELLAEAFNIMVIQGDIEESKVDSYKTHFYAPSMMEIDTEIRREGSFKIERFEMFQGSNDSSIINANALTNAVRAIQEPMILNHFGEEVCDNLFRIYGKMMNKRFTKEHVDAANLILVLRKSL